MDSKNLKSLPEGELIRILDPENILEARKYCGREGPSNIRELYSAVNKILSDRKSGKEPADIPEQNTEDIVRKKRTQTKKQAAKKEFSVPKSAKEVVIGVLKSLKETREDRNVEYNEFCRLVENDLRKYGLDDDNSCPKSGFVSKLLYDIAAHRLIPSSTRKKGSWNRLKTEMGKVKIINPIRPNELEKILGLNFGEKANDQIVGILDENYARENYPISEGRVIYVEDGEWYHENPSIEGTPNWDGEGKEKSRKALVGFVQSNLLKDIGALQKNLEEKVKTITAEIARLTSEENQYRENLENVAGKKKERVYVLSGGWRDVNRIVRKKFVDGILRGRTKGMNFKYISEGNKAKLEIRCDDEFAGKTLMRSWREHTSSFPGVKDNFDELDEKSQEEADNLRNRMSMAKNTRENLKKILDDNKKNLEYMVKNPSVNYLGLEGPNFRSFLDLSNMVGEKGLAINGMFIEYEDRIFNLMESIMRGNAGKGAFDGCKTQKRDIDEAIMLDFVEDQNIKLVPARDNGDEGEKGIGFKVVYDHTPAKTKRKSRIRHRREEIPYERYDEIINMLDSGLISPENISEMYDISEKFASAITCRPKGKFNVVFLDYLGSIRRYDRKPVLEILLKRRISDKAVIATTFNVSKRMIPLHEGKSRDEGEIFDYATEAFNASGYDGIDMAVKTYQDKSDKMSFQAYYIKKR